MITGTSGQSRFGFREQFQTGHPRHIDVGQNQDERHASRICNVLKGYIARWRKSHREAASA